MNDEIHLVNTTETQNDKHDLRVKSTGDRFPVSTNLFLASCSTYHIQAGFFFPLIL